MTHSKIFKREDGSRINVEVRLYIPFSFRGDEIQFEWRTFISKSDPGKRKFYVDLSGEEVPWVTPEEILETKLELWNKIKPTI